LVYRVITVFRKAPLQLAILRDKQKEVYGKEIALIASVLTRWGTQYRVLKVLMTNMRVLQYYTTDSVIKMEREILNDITDNGFWNKLSDILRIIESLHEV